MIASDTMHSIVILIYLFVGFVGFVGWVFLVAYMTKGMFGNYDNDYRKINDAMIKKPTGEDKPPK